MKTVARNLTSYGWLLCFVGCGVMGPTATDTVTRSIPIGNVNQITIYGFNGSISVTGQAVDEVEIVAKRRARGGTIEAAKSNLDLLDVVTEIQGDRLVVKADRPKGFSGGVSYDIKLPPAWVVKAETSNGSVKVRQASAVDVNTSNGSVNLNQIFDRAVVKTSNGSVGVTSDSPISLDINTSNGSVKYRGPLNSGKHQVRTSNGSVAIELSGPPVLVAASTSNGKITIGNQSGKKNLESMIGEGDISESELGIRTSNGRVTVTHTPGENPDISLLQP